MAQPSKLSFLRQPRSEAQITKKRARLEAGHPSGPHGFALLETNSLELQGRERQRSKAGSGVVSGDGSMRRAGDEDASRSITPPFRSPAPAEAKQIVLSEGLSTTAKVSTASMGMKATAAASLPPISGSSSSRCSSSPSSSFASSAAQQPSSESSRVSKAPPLSGSSSATPTAPRLSPASSKVTTQMRTSASNSMQGAIPVQRSSLGVAPVVRRSHLDGRALLSTSKFPRPRVFPGGAWISLSIACSRSVCNHACSCPAERLE